MTSAEHLGRFPVSGDGPPDRRRRITQQVIRDYAEASGDHNPIHLDREYAQGAGLPTTIAHGLLTLGTACAAVEDWASEVSWTARVACRFSAPVLSGDELSCSGRVTEATPDAASVDLTALTSSGDRALTKARVELRALPET